MGARSDLHRRERRKSKRMLRRGMVREDHGNKRGHHLTWLVRDVVDLERAKPENAHTHVASRFDAVDALGPLPPLRVPLSAFVDDDDVRA